MATNESPLDGDTTGTDRRTTRETKLTDDWGTKAAAGTDPTAAADTRPAADHPAVQDIPVDKMVLSHPVDGFGDIPHPDEIETLVEEDVATEQPVLPEHVRDARDEITDNPTPEKFLVLSPTEVYEYLYKLQRTNDLHFENFHRRQLIINQLSNGRRNGSTTKLSTYDKKWLAKWEAHRRLRNRDFDQWKEGHLTKEQDGLSE